MKKLSSILFLHIYYVHQLMLMLKNVVIKYGTFLIKENILLKYIKNLMLI
jgi:hypothetical protein